MGDRKNKYRSVNLTRFYMKIVGLWIPRNKFEEKLLNVALLYAVAAILFAIAVESVDLYYVRSDFDGITYNLCATMLLLKIMIKFSSFMYYRNIVYNIIDYAERNFWEVDYDEYGTKVLKECDRKGVMLIYTFTLIVQLGALNYIYTPLVENRGKNETDRMLPFKLWVDLPVTTSPYYEIIYTIQSLSTIHSGICTFCFDNFVCCFNIHVAAQLKIVGHKFEVVVDEYLESLNDNIKCFKDGRSVRSLFANCVRDHLKLVKYVEKMEQAFTWILLGQLLLSSISICIGGFRFATSNTIRIKFFFFPHCFGNILQIYLYTWACNDIAHESNGLSTCVYNIKWYLLPHDETGKMIKHGIVMVLCRVRRPLVLTAGKFAPVTLETFKSIVSTAVSYFTMMQQMSESTG
uniref:Odorant receptor n=1 Tax=Campoletis chlorideae TaxID=219166 RepID=A0A346D3Z7_9HYME|nr:odorant receptor [Campoletis chlorideae]